MANRQVWINLKNGSKAPMKSAEFSMTVKILKLPPGDHHHPTFHVSKIKPFLMTDDDEALGGTTKLISSQ